MLNIIALLLVPDLLSDWGRSAEQLLFLRYSNILCVIGSNDTLLVEVFSKWAGTGTQALKLKRILLLLGDGYKMSTTVPRLENCAEWIHRFAKLFKKNKITGYLGIQEALQIIRFLLLTSFHQPENSLCSQSVYKLHSSVFHLWKNHWDQHTHVWGMMLSGKPAIFILVSPQPLLTGKGSTEIEKTYD